MNKTELLRGFIFGVFFLPILGWYAIPMALLTAYLWALSGMQGHGKYWRRHIMTGIPALAWLIKDDNLMAIVSYALAVGVMSIGYGIPQKK